MAFVYWIRLKEHTDIFTQGYVGITTKTVDERFTRHRENANCVNGVKTILHKAFLKYGSHNLIVECIVECSKEYASWFESVLRPKRYIGWNIATGGEAPMNMQGFKHSDETKLIMRELKLGKKQSREHVEKIRATNLRKNPWDRPSAKKDTWKDGDLYYLAWLSCKSHQTVAKKFRLTVGTLNSVFANFDKSYNPFLDKNWESEFSFNRNPDDVVTLLKSAELYIPIMLLTQYLDYYKLEGAS